MIKKYKITKFKIIALFISVFTFIFRLILKNNEELTEIIYSKGIYRVISIIFSNVSGILPFSIAEFLAVILVVLAIVFLIKFIKKLIRQKKDRKIVFIRSIINILVTLLFFYSFFNLAWGINYERKNPYDIFNLHKTQFDQELLEEMISSLSKEAYFLRGKLDENDDGITKINGSITDALKRANKGYDNISKIYPELSGNYPRPKKIIFSEIYSYTGMWGFYSPFTFEANVNSKIPSPFFLSAAMHEMAHMRGFANENVANYIAYLSCKYHPDFDYKYSGVILALRYSLISLRRNDKEAYNISYSKLDEGIKRDLESRYDFSDKYTGFIDNISSDINNLFLKSNGVSSGIQSYGQVVDLLISEYLR